MTSMDNSQSQPPIENQPVGNQSTEQIPKPHLQAEQQALAQPEQAPALGRTQSPAPAQTAQPNAPTQQVYAHQVHNTNAQTHLNQAIAKLTASDEDLIEKEWVDLAEKVMDVSKDDPRAEDQQQQLLNKAYLKKRFNLDVK